MIDSIKYQKKKKKMKQISFADNTERQILIDRREHKSIEDYRHIV
jgi:hypothetical protein